MTEVVQKCDRVLRKRKIHNVSMDKTAHNTAKKQKVYNVMDEHNYCRRSEKKSCRWPVKRRSLVKSYGNPNKMSVINIDENIKETEPVSNQLTAYECVLPPFKWIHLIYLSVKNSNRDYVTAMDVQKFVRHWFSYYTEEHIIQIICSTFMDFEDTCLTSPSSLNEDHYFRIWTVDRNFVNVLEEELMFYVEENKTMIKSTMTNPDCLSRILKGYGVHNLGYDQQLRLDI